MKRRLDGRKAVEKYALEIPFISDFYFTNMPIWIFIP
jgi:hypothetical protein